MSAGADGQDQVRGGEPASGTAPGWPGRAVGTGTGPGHQPAGHARVGRAHGRAGPGGGGSGDQELSVSQGQG